MLIFVAFTHIDLLKKKFIEKKILFKNNSIKILSWFSGHYYYFSKR